MNPAKPRKGNRIRCQLVKEKEIQKEKINTKKKRRNFLELNNTTISFETNKIWACVET